MAVYSLQQDGAAEEFIERLRRRLYRAFAAVLITVIISTLGLVALGRHQERPFGDRLSLALWDTLNLVSTVGSLEEEFTPAQRAWAMVVIIFGLGAVLYGFGVIQGLLHGGDVQRIQMRRKMEKNLNDITAHLIVCGYGHVGESVARMIHKAGRPVVVIDKNSPSAEKADGDGFLTIHADATDENALQQAGVDRAVGLIATLDTDEANVYLCLIARELNPKIRIVTRAERPETRSTLQRAGANRVIVPGEVAGLQMSHLMLKPHVSEFIAGAIGEGEYEFGEIELKQRPTFIGKTLRELNLPQRASALVIALIDDQGRQVFNPPADRALTENDMLIIVSPEGGMNRLAEIK